MLHVERELFFPLPLNLDSLIKYRHLIAIYILLDSDWFMAGTRGSFAVWGGVPQLALRLSSIQCGVIAIVSRTITLKDFNESVDWLAG